MKPLTGWKDCLQKVTKLSWFHTPNTVLNIPRDQLSGRRATVVVVHTTCGMGLNDGFQRQIQRWNMSKRCLFSQQIQRWRNAEFMVDRCPDGWINQLDPGLSSGIVQKLINCWFVVYLGCRSKLGDDTAMRNKKNFNLPFLMLNNHSKLVGLLLVRTRNPAGVVKFWSINTFELHKSHHLPNTEMGHCRLGLAAHLTRLTITRLLLSTNKVRNFRLVRVLQFRRRSTFMLWRKLSP